MVANKLKTLYGIIGRNISHILFLSFVFGFVFDALTLPSSNNYLSLIIGGLYVLSSTLLIILREVVRGSTVNTKDIESRLKDKADICFGLLISFVLGSFLSFNLIYYFRSSDIYVSAPLLLLIALVLVANEFVKRSSRLILDLFVLILSTTLYTLFAIPFLLKSVGDKVFLLGILIASIYSLLLISMLHTIMAKESRVHKYSGKVWYRYAINSLVLIPSIIGAMYFLNIIPAVPLTLSGSNVYALLSKDAVTGNYNLIGPASTTINIFKLPVANLNTEGSLTYYAAVKAPTNMNTSVNHSWQKYNDSSKSWDTIMNVSFPIKGGRDEGYRGYSVKTNVKPGLYRIFVTTGNRHIGSFKFIVE